MMVCGQIPQPTTGADLSLKKQWSEVYMRILLTGAFGNIGMSTLQELLRQGHQVRCFVPRHKANERTARRFAGKIELIQGDIRRPAHLSAARPEPHVIIHLAYMIPPRSDDQPDIDHS